MKTKPKLRARRMWANYYQFCPAPHIFDSKARAMSWAKDYPATITIAVAVIPLDDVNALAQLAADAYFNAWNAELATRKEAMRAALAAIGVLPKQRKGGAK